jgi:hypothetical protein
MEPLSAQGRPGWCVLSQAQPRRMAVARSLSAGTVAAMAVPGPEGDDHPKVTAAMLARAAAMCPRRLALDHADQRANSGANRRYRLLNQLEADARLAHTSLAAPRAGHFRPTDDLFPEERAVYAVAARWYVALFGDQPMVVADAETDDMSTVAPRLGVRLTGPAGLALESADGSRELRLLSIGDRSRDEVLDAPRTKFALLRRARWTMEGPLRVVRADLLGGWSVGTDLDGQATWPELRSWLEAGIATIRHHADRTAPRAGQECARCPFIAGCGALR